MYLKLLIGIILGLLLANLFALIFSPNLANKAYSQAEQIHLTSTTLRGKTREWMTAIWRYQSAMKQQVRYNTLAKYHLIEQDSVILPEPIPPTDYEINGAWSRRLIYFAFVVFCCFVDGTLTSSEAGKIIGHPNVGSFLHTIAHVLPNLTILIYCIYLFGAFMLMNETTNKLPEVVKILPNCSPSEQRTRKALALTMFVLSGLSIIDLLFHIPIESFFQTHFHISNMHLYLQLFLGNVTGLALLGIVLAFAGFIQFIVIMISFVLGNITVGFFNVVGLLAVFCKMSFRLMDSKATKSSLRSEKILD